jgi:hypothetical protein
MYLPLNKFLRRFNMISLLKKLFGAKPAEQTAEALNKVEATPTPLGTEATIIAVSHADMPINASTIEVVPAAVVEQVASVKPAKKPAPKKQQPAKKPAAPKTATAKAPPKPKAKPAA